jgi:hypothetical protein
MWICDGCKMLVTLEVAGPQIDDGIYFICPVCHERNELRALPRLGPDDPLDLEQIHKAKKS